jgi:diguanylate cyclase (GGDEF)-like protein
MRLTRAAPSESPSAIIARPRQSARVSFAILAAVMALVFAVDWLTDLSRVQHLYYFPIIFAAVRFGMRGGAGAAAVAILLYHVANPHMLSARYEEVDVLQMAVFLAAGLVSARLADDARRLHRLAMTDDLTGLHNLRSFEAELKAMVSGARATGVPVSMLVLDVDRLKSLNDQHGHLTGAEAVRTIGHLIAAHIPADAVACRYGGDEFAIALPHCASLTAYRIADDLRAVVQATAPVLAGVPFPVQTLSISVGVASRTFSASAATAADEDDGEGLFRSADAALYFAKNGGRNRVHSA